MKLPIPRLLLAAALLLPLALQAQIDPVKFGKVEASDFDKSGLKNSENAPAVVLCDFGKSYIQGAQDGFKVVFERVTRVLILSKAGYEQATVEVPLYRRENEEERLLNLRGFTYNLVNGKVEKQKLDDKAVFREQVDANYSRQKFTLPNVREGSVVEYAYTVKSDFLFNLQDWQFQRDIPVAWSEYRTVIPGFFVYKEIPHGYHPFAVQDRQLVPYSTTYRETRRDGYGGDINSSPQSTHLTTQALSSRWVMTDLPALRPEPYMTTLNDYRAALDFELHLIQFDPKSPQPITSTWEQINKELLKHEHFGEILTDRSPLAAPAAALAARYPDPTERARAVLALVQQTLRYNGEERAFASASLRQTLDKKQGNSAELNLLLVHTLRDAGLGAAPVLVSTRRHGRVQTELPLLSQFNYVVASLRLPNDKEMLLDATEPLLPLGALPERCLNGQGHVVDAAAGKWVSLAPTQQYLRLTNARLAFNEQGQLKGKIETEYGGYAGLDERNRLAEAGEKAYFTKLLNQHPDWQLTGNAVKRTDELAAPLHVDFDVTLPTSAGADKLYLPLMQLFTDGQNPFQNDVRSFPVDFGMTRELISTVMLTLPAGYTVAELPAKTILELPNNAGRYHYEATQQGGTLQIVSRLQLRKPEYRPSEYAALRELFTRSVAKHAEPLVLQKN